MSESGINTETTEEKMAGKKGILPANKFYVVLILLMALLGAAFLAMLAVVKAFPANMTMAFVAAMFIMLLLSGFLLGRSKRVFRILGLLVAVACVLMKQLLDDIGETGG